MAQPARPGPRGSTPHRRRTGPAPERLWLKKQKSRSRSATRPSQESGVAAASEPPCPESSLGRKITKLRSPWPTNPPPDSGEIREIPPQFPAELPGQLAPAQELANHPLSRVAYTARPIVRGFCRNVSARTADQAMARSSSESIPVARSERLVLGLFTAAVFLSALLLFGVQPMFSRMVLPQLGGSPSVWSVAMVFFQSMLLAGYAYAHFLAGTQNRRLAVAMHLALLTGALLMLPLSIADWGAPPSSGPPFGLRGVFPVSIGLPFFALAANNPLLQTWFVRTGHREAHDPYFLYAASNIGRSRARASYPLLVEPPFTLPTQCWMWSGGFVLLVALIAACGIVMLRSGSDP